MVAEYCVFARPNRSRLDGSMLEKTARRCGVSRSTVLRAFKRFVMLLAQAAAEEPGEP
jgi:AraC-like DNA-binding protein